MRATLAVLLLFAAACGQNEGREKPAGREAEVVPPPSERAVRPLEGALTIERLVAAKDGVRPYDPWSKAWAHLVATVGEPSASEGEVFRWTLLVGETCHVLEVRRAEDRVDGVMYGPYEKGTPQHERCAASGK